MNADNKNFYMHQYNLGGFDGNGKTFQQGPNVLTVTISDKTEITEEDARRIAQAIGFDDLSFIKFNERELVEDDSRM